MLTDEKLVTSRNAVLKFFNTNSNEYSVIFTSGATGALKMIGEYFSWEKESLYYYLRINHNSVLGIREYIAEIGGYFKALNENEISKILYDRKKSQKKNDVNNPINCLFAFPAKDNFAGVLYPLEWIEDIKKYGLSDKCHWYVLADVAAYVPSHKFDLSKYIYLDFAVVSFYKMFGYPTGIGALIVKNSSSRVFKKIYFGGGSVVTAVCDSRICKRQDKNSFSHYEDGTLPFLGINALLFGFDILSKISYDIITNHIKALSEFTFYELINIRHSNFTKVAKVYHAYDSPLDGIIAFNLFDINNKYIPFSLVESIAAFNNIHLRGGCFCNSGACQDYLNLNNEEIIESYKDKNSCTENGSSDNKPFGAIRISFGYLSTFKDSFVFIQFIKDNFVK
ncbi:aminotransferase, putative [Plasmodium gallinaceum]|uniref:Aminotransferase, putative n=1 Tax=Plasmodium gallinaceum TaxID=5849 RepID=A0A1J1GUR8_PLAGA|nr:aminotransferase, putative [Plasmodium gallinaceum]CRG95987.1 aminotransferase, putative [Plasmodium gallinaceum]